MDALVRTVSDVPLVDVLAVGILALGLLVGALTGLGRAFGTLLYLVAGLWLAAILAPVVLQWMPNTTHPGDERAIELTYGGLAALWILLPLLGKAVSRHATGRKRGDRGPGGEHRVFGGLVGTMNAALVVVLAAPYVTEFEPLECRDATAPRAASTVAGHLGFLFPASHGTAHAAPAPAEAAPRVGRGEQAAR